MRPLDLNGHAFGRLTVLGRSSPKPDGAIWWSCKCVCGSTKDVRGADLKRGFVLSCGCWNSQRTANRNRTHGESGTRLYHIWQAMRGRTGNPKASRYSYYGGRGISVCPEWNDFEQFRDWALSNGYADNLSIDRIDNDGNYEPSNCRWADQKTQVRNRRPRTAFPPEERKVS
jgi:hypothetical protein